MKIKKQKAKKVPSENLKFQGHKNYLEASQIENKINHLEKRKLM